MMSVPFKSIVAVVSLLTSSTSLTAIAAAPVSKSLVFVGKVTSLSPTGADEFKRWVVTVRVERVITGDFSSSTFEFAVHSPARSGLEKGKSYTIEAVWRGTGYSVDELQWMKRNRAGMLPDNPQKLCSGRRFAPR